METDSRISAQVDFIVYSEETWNQEIEILDATGVAVNIDAFTAGPLIIYDKRTDKILVNIPDVTTVGTKLKILHDLPKLKKNMTTGNYWECPLVSAAGLKAMVHGIIHVDGK